MGSSTLALRSFSSATSPSKSSSVGTAVEGECMLSDSRLHVLLRENLENFVSYFLLISCSCSWWLDPAFEFPVTALLSSSMPESNGKFIMGSSS